ILLYAVTVLSIFLNSVLIVVVLNKKCRNVGDYRYLLVANAILSISTSCIVEITHPLIVISEFGFLAVSQSFLDEPGFIENLGTRLFNLTFYEPFCILALQFVHRYNTLVRLEKSTKAQLRKYVCMYFLIFVAFTCLAAVPAYIASMDSDRKRMFFVNASEFTTNYVTRNDSQFLALMFW
ncbi:hypothetical protein PENTCL1PPCAC_12623, partial [Pristionchus entomophagus]